MSNSIFNKVMVFLRLREEADTECVSLRELRPFWDFQMFNIDDHNRRSKLVDAYWAVWRFFRYGWGNPRNAYTDIKWFIQRGRRGWADCDVWSLDDYMNGWLPDALRRLKATKHGVPGSMFEGLPTNEHGYHDAPEFAIAEARWDAIMDKMIAGFEADKRAQEGLYEEELGFYPLDRPSGVSAEAWSRVKDNRMEAAKALTERDQKLFEEGMALFVKHWHSLWD